MEKVTINRWCYKLHKTYATNKHGLRDIELWELGKLLHTIPTYPAGAVNTMSYDEKNAVVQDLVSIDKKDKEKLKRLKEIIRPCGDKWYNFREY
jgi:hypothetical protein